LYRGVFLPPRFTYLLGSHSRSLIVQHTTNHKLLLPHGQLKSIVGVLAVICNTVSGGGWQTWKSIGSLQKEADMEWLNPAVIVVYLVAMVMFGFWGKRRTKNVSDYLVAGRRLGPIFYTATLVTVVLGGASAIGGVGLGYEHGISGMWMVASFVMLAYTLMICATSTGAYASIFVVLFDWERWVSVLVGGSVVLIYSVIGGMFSITLADVVQFVVMTIGLFFLMVPYGLSEAGGWAGMQERL